MLPGDPGPLLIQVNFATRFRIPQSGCAINAYDAQPGVQGDRIPCMIRFSLALLFACQLGACSLLHGDWDDDRGFDSTYRKILARAERGDPERQNAVGFMLFQGEGASMDRVQARLWFSRAAEQGNLRARRNLSIMAALGPAAYAPPDSDGRGRRPAADLPRAESYYLTFCSGCHGVNGVAAYENSPSFAFGERLEKGDAMLMRTVLAGRQEMPGWDGKLPLEELQGILAFVRTLNERYESGIGEILRAPPEYYDLFGPMDARRRAILDTQ